MSDYPEHDKMLVVRDQADAIGAFLEWQRAEETPYVLGVWQTQTECTNSGRRPPSYDVQDKTWHQYRYWHCRDGRLIDDEDPTLDHGVCGECGGMGLVDRIEPQLVPAGVGIEALLAEYLGINLQKIAEEKDEMLRRIRANDEEK